MHGIFAESSFGFQPFQITEKGPKVRLYVSPGRSPGKPEFINGKSPNGAILNRRCAGGSIRGGNVLVIDLPHRAAPLGLLFHSSSLTQGGAAGPGLIQAPRLRTLPGRLPHNHTIFRTTEFRISCFGFRVT